MITGGLQGHGRGDLWTWDKRKPVIYWRVWFVTRGVPTNRCTWIGKQAACVSYMSIWEEIKRKRKAILKQVTLNGHCPRCPFTLKCVGLSEVLENVINGKL